MLNFLLVTTKKEEAFPAYTPSEEIIIDKIIKANKTKLSLQVVYSETNSNTLLFKRLPVLFINNKIIDNQSLLFFIRDLLYLKLNLPESESNHFNYLIDFLKKEYRQIYISNYYTLKQNKRSTGFPLGKIKAFNDFFNSTKEKDYVKLIIKSFIEEYQAVIRTENISFSIKDKEINEASLSVKGLSTDDIIRLIDKHAMSTNLSKISLNNELIIKDIEVKSWRGSFYTFGIFFGITIAFYMFSYKMKQ